MTYALVAAAILLAALVTAWALHRRRAVWTAFARAHGLRASWKGPRIWGTVDGRAFDLRVSGSSSDATEVVWSLELRSAPPGLRVVPGGWAGEMRRVLGEPLVETGDPDFDARVAVLSLDPAGTSAWLTPARRAALESLIGSGGGAMAGIEQERLVLREREAISRPEHLEERLGLLRAAADGLDRSGL